MQLSYDKDKLRHILDSFETVSGMSVGIMDSNLNFIARSTSSPKPICAQIQSLPGGTERCRKSDRELVRECLKKKCPVSHTCHAGLTDTAFPMFHNGIPVGFLIFGQVLVDGKAKPAFREIFDHVQDLNPDPALLRANYRNMKFFRQKEITCAAEIIQMLIQYIWSEHIILEKAAPLLKQILQYIHEHLASDLCVESLCQQFSVCKSTLYRIFDTELGIGVKNYINLQRLSMAEMLLRTTDLPVAEISEQTGFSNQNYFCRAFKRKNHTTPVRYRKGNRV